ncbi:hypothetical protein PCANC_07044 [Puccinia coronata f. sp. avenae]|uniref:Uncharacterized protein n=1 Tax=Puccinia coronata f. sp. avenae TaxID=200324 RepID=A0A2N5VZK5_9BASI|nr:hypothetical protein PCANC_07044 [Puccinia coronata f. sp. avenae]
MSSSSIDLGKTILAKLQSQLSQKKQNPANPARAGSKRGAPSSAPTNKNESAGSSNVKKNKSSSDKPVVQQKTNSGRQPEPGSSSGPRHADQKPAKRTSSSDIHPADQKSAKRKKTSDNVPVDQDSKPEGDEELNSQDSDDETNHRRILLQEIKSLGGTEGDLDLCEGSSSDEVEIPEDQEADPALVNDLKSFMKGLDFAAALKSVPHHDDDSPDPSPAGTVTNEPTHTSSDGGQEINPTTPSSSSAKQKVNKKKKKKKNKK